MYLGAAKGRRPSPERRSGSLDVRAPCPCAGDPWGRRGEGGTWMAELEEDVRRAVERIGGRECRDCYQDLCRMVEAAIPHMPGTFSMEELYPAVQLAADKQRSALTKSLSRAAEDIWANGSRAALGALWQRPPRYRPSPKELVRALAMSVWRERRSGVHYYIMETKYPKRFGVVGERSDPPDRLIVLLPGQDRESAERLAEQFEREQVPLQEAGQRLLQAAELLLSGSEG